MSAKTRSNALKKTNITIRFAGISGWKVTMKYIKPFRKKMEQKKMTIWEKQQPEKGKTTH